MAQLFVYLGSFFAQLELNRFKPVPWTGTGSQGQGPRYRPEGRELLYGMASRLLDGWSFVRIAAWLNESGALTKVDRARVAKGQEAKRRPWTVSTAIDALTSPRTHGLKMHKRETVLDGRVDLR
jgi:site-specific DNA recombinase